MDLDITIIRLRLIGGAIPKLGWGGTTPVSTRFPPTPVSFPFPPKPVSTPFTLTGVELLHFVSSVVTVSTFVLGLGLVIQDNVKEEDKLKQAKDEIIAEVQKVRVDTIAELKKVPSVKTSTNNLKKPNKWFWFW
ncbi:hypothetical protein LOK49_LG06G03064 [Camellia lanceoleosa]|uniref:Uncharacterized protein n=1 Tax=Camellia lanceoleosa TaxID=1840588 RepID=A0ACC0HCG6_9ERIC|nr:hypothetical protein LOK49_LG06G03064 [Camellia lanceoleosa]